MSVLSDGHSICCSMMTSERFCFIYFYRFEGDVMVVGEPTLMGGEFGDEDERLITRLENSQFDAAAAAAAGLGGPDGPSGPDSGGSGASLNGPMGPMGGDHPGNGPHMGPGGNKTF